MKKWILTLVGFLFGYQLAIAADPITVDRVELNQYLGTWYEVARLPNSFEPDEAKNITAAYALNADGTIRVENQCWVNGKATVARGVARVEDTKTNAKLAVSFFDILGFRPIWGDYWILALGPNYSYSVVGDRSRKFAWILSRSPRLNTQDMNHAVDSLNKNGYDTKRLIYPVHTD